MLRPLLVALAISLACVTLALAQEVAINPTDSVKAVIAAQKEKRITLRLRSGQELTGIVREVGGRLIVLGSLTGREYFDAVVPLEMIEAVLIRTKP